MRFKTSLLTMEVQLTCMAYPAWHMPTQCLTHAEVKTLASAAHSAVQLHPKALQGHSPCWHKPKPAPMNTDMC